MSRLSFSPAALRRRIRRARPGRTRFNWRLALALLLNLLVWYGLIQFIANR